ncbi:MAG: hypothetical protein IRZ15_14490 [Bryobacteraceae bacterium]|nr:hypothetical protein [Bryobacteraceae bacterium]
MSCRSVLLGLCLSFRLLAQGGLFEPRIAVIAKGEQGLWQVRGIWGGFALTPVKADPVVSAAFTGQAGAVKLQDQLILLNESLEEISVLPAPPGRALFGFAPDGALKAVWYPEAKRIDLIAEGLAVDTSLWAGDPISIAAMQGRCLKAALMRDDGLWLLDADSHTGAIQSAMLLPDVRPPVLVRPDGSVVFSRDGALIVRDAAGVERAAPAPLADAIGEAGKDALVVRSGSSFYLVRLGEESLQVFPLPNPRGQQ